jgi:hypothetical protein
VPLSSRHCAFHRRKSKTGQSPWSPAHLVPGPPRSPPIWSWPLRSGSSISHRRSSRNIRRDIVERADGVPLFAEEIAKAAVEATGEGGAERVLTGAWDVGRLSRLGCQSLLQSASQHVVENMAAPRRNRSASLRNGDRDRRGHRGVGTTDLRPTADDHMAVGRFPENSRDVLRLVGCGQRDL